MTDEQQDILISAYLDDELSPDERARVEQLLATSAEARQLVEELRSLRNSLKQLPPHQLNPDFSARVLAKAEREISAGSSMPTASRCESASGSRWRRPLVWTALTLAAALLLLVTNRPEDERQMVRAPEKKEKALSKMDRDQPGEGINTPMAGQSLDKRIQLDDAPVAAPAPAAASLESVAESSDAAKPQQPRSEEVDRARSLVLSSENEVGAALMKRAESSGEAKDQELLVISVDLTPAAASSKEFGQLLARHQIRTDAGPQSGVGPADGQQQQEKLAVAADEQTALDQSLGVTLDARMKSNQPTTVYVSASRQQIDAAVAELQATPQLFPAVAVAATDQKQLQPGAAPPDTMMRGAAPSGGVAQSLSRGDSGASTAGGAGVGGLGAQTDRFEGAGAAPAMAPMTSSPEAAAPRGSAIESRSGERARLSFSAPSKVGSAGNAQEAVPRELSEALPSPVRAVFVLRIVDPQGLPSGLPAK